MRGDLEHTVHLSLTQIVGTPDLLNEITSLLQLKYIIYQHHHFHIQLLTATVAYSN
jgi:hypothetical protein